MATKTKNTKKQPAKQSAKRASKSDPVTLQVPAACRCGSSEKFKPLPNSKPIERAIIGEIHGFGYRRVTWQRQRCECGSIFDLRTYHGS